VQVVIGELPSDDELASSLPQQKDKQVEEATTERLGMILEDIPVEVRESRSIHSGGVFVKQIEPGSSADRSGIKEGDVISRINYVVIEGIDHLLQILDRLPDGKSVPVYVVRDKGPIFLALRMPD